MSILKISAESERDVEYDIVRLSICFYSVSSDACKASKDVLNECEDFLSKIEEKGISINNFSIGKDTSERAFSDEKMYYKARREVTIKMKYNMIIIHMIQNILISNKYNATYDVDYFITNENKILEELTREAILCSKKNAEEIAKSLGMRIIGIEKADTEVPRYGGSSLCEIPSFEKVAGDTYIHSAGLKAPIKKVRMEATVDWILE